MVTLMAVNVLSHFTTGRAYWDVSPPIVQTAGRRRVEGETRQVSLVRVYAIALNTYREAVRDKVSSECWCSRRASWR